MGDQHRPAQWSGKRSVRAVETSPAPQQAEPPEQVSWTDEDGDVYATAAARAYAAEHGIDLDAVAGTGREGRITKDDVAALTETAE